MSKVIVGSKNPVKIDAVRQGFVKIWPKIHFKVIGHDVPSGVSPQPLSTEESLTGAKNRAHAALATDSTADYGVGLEGGLEKIGDEWFDCGWIVIVNQAGVEGIASTARIHTPASIMTHINQGKELGDAMDYLFNQTNSKQAQGQFGLMTNNAVTRTDGYTQAVILACARFLHPELFTK